VQRELELANQNFMFVRLKFDTQPQRMHVFQVDYELPR
jgi:hypothetical protein